jgi:hypothetical protein
LVAIDGMIGTPREIGSLLFYSLPQLSKMTLVRAALWWPLKRLLLRRERGGFGGPMAMWTFSLYLSKGYGKDLKLGLEDFLPFLDEREMVRFWLRHARAAGLVSEDTSDDEIVAQLLLSARLTSAYRPMMPDGRLGYPALMVCGAGYLSADPSNVESGGPHFDRLKQLQRYCTRGWVMVKQVGPANHLQVLYEPFQRQVAAAVNDFLLHVRAQQLLPTVPTEEQRRVDTVRVLLSLRR